MKQLKASGGKRGGNRRWQKWGVIKPTPCAMPQCCKDCAIEMVLSRDRMGRDVGELRWSEVCARGWACRHWPLYIFYFPMFYDPWWYHTHCCNCEKERGWKHYNQKGCVQCKNRAAAKAAAEKDAAEKLGRRAIAKNLDEFLRDMCEIHDEERKDVVDAFMDPRYMVNSTPKFFALDEKDLDTILASLSLGTRRLIKSAWLEMGLHGGAARG